ncbi:alpha/beta hydrolase-fold protein [Limibacter armeniacum]|uniref:alpha/beta hydrolase n=1 Tax=Limibacter armeniacum TaxID=466084 RepID=UPI002FE5EC4D
MSNSSFRTTERSMPKFERENLRFITVKSRHLQGRGDICVFVPQDVKEENLPIAILLHGVYGSAWVWSFLGGAHLTAQQMIEEGRIRPMVLAMPSDGLWGDGSGYLKHHSGQDFEKWIVEDVVQAVRENISCTSSSSPLFIGGLSMGGFGALKLGSKYGHLFKGISAHSAITEVEQMQLFVEEPLENYRQHERSDEDVLTSIRQSPQLPALRFDCGTSDELIDFNRHLHKQLIDHNIEHQYEEFDGGHQWEYWQLHLQDSLCFFDRLLP